MQVIADNLTISNPVIANSIKNRDKNFFYPLFKRAEEEGYLVDVNLGQLKRDIPDVVKFLFGLINEFKDIKIVIDTINPTTIEEILKYCQTPPILNAFSKDDFKLKELLPIAVKNELDIVALVMDKSIPLTVDEKINLAIELVDIFTQNGVPYSKIILDPVVAPIGWENGAMYNRNNLEFLKLVKEAISPDIRSMMGLSNLTTGSTGKDRSVRKLDSLYLAMAYCNSLDYALVNINDPEIVNAITFLNILEDKTIFTPSLFK